MPRALSFFPLSKTYPTARAAIILLEKAEILKETSGRQWGRIYLCPAVLEALETPFG
jgi:hypothetical protein